MQFMTDRKREMLDRALRDSNGSFLELRRKLERSERKRRDQIERERSSAVRAE